MDEQTIPHQNISLSGVSGGGEIDIYTYFTASPYFAGFTSHNSPDMKIFLGLYRTLPDSLRQFIASDETALTIFTTGQSFNLDDGQIFNLAKTIRELVIGNIFIKDFPITISSKLGIDDIKAGEIANNIISKSFSPILEDVKRIQRSKFPDKISQMQKESRPSKLTQPQAGEARSRGAAQPAEIGPQKPSISQEVKNMPLTRPGVGEARPEGAAQPSARPAPAIRSEAPPQSAPLPTLSQPQQMRPALGARLAPEERPPVAPPPIRTEPVKPPEVKQAPIQTPLPQPQIMSDIKPKPPITQAPPSRPPSLGEARPEGPQFKVPDLGQSFSSAPQNKQTTSGTKPDNDAQKSLEQELEKVANVIDLRAGQDK